MPVPILLEPTTTKLNAQAEGAVIVSGSHGGRYPGYAAAKARVRAVVLNDAGVGKDEAGIGSLPYLEALGIAAATVSHASCRIGDAADMMARGHISHANAIARAAGVLPGMACAHAAELLRDAPCVVAQPPTLGESRTEVVVPDGKRRIMLLDSAALVRPQDVGQIVVTGSHGALVGGNPAMALQVDGFAGVFNDAGGGAEGAGFTRLPALDMRGIAAITVAASSARIGEAGSIFHDGVVSAANETALRLGAQAGQRANELLTRWAMLD
ncbi:hypothetical protein [Variovorax sp. Root411]|uniref:hypothetical protein n=1 Tax=Variovorax sp. Root411 TaxID=1736530 RepID=UPI0006F8C4FB|nr:hypothetical protein [Variovorax sp. Root411]KQW56424.1 hypothetical protein ASC92_15980 [Variovorax sp. Root411]